MGHRRSPQSPPPPSSDFLYFHPSLLYWKFHLFHPESGVFQTVAQPSAIPVILSALSLLSSLASKFHPEYCTQPRKGTQAHEHSSPCYALQPPSSITVSVFPSRPATSTTNSTNRPPTDSTSSQLKTSHNPSIVAATCTIVTTRPQYWPIAMLFIAVGSVFVQPASTLLWVGGLFHPPLAHLLMTHGREEQGG